MDDRPPENLSFAAINLVKPGLRSKRQQSEPPMNRNVFPPTPPPESEKASTPSQMSRAASVRNGPKPIPAKLNIERARPNERYEIHDDPPPQIQGQRIGTTRTASEPRGPPARQYSQRERSRGPARPPRLSIEEEQDEYPGELYDMYQNSRSNRSTGGRPRMRTKYFEEEEEYASDYDDGFFDENDFEMVSNRPPISRSASTSGRGQSRRPEIRKIRLKVHAEDVRYIMIRSTIEFPDLVEKIREKFGLEKRFKIKIRDDDVPSGDMITMGDPDDLEMVMMSVKAAARRERLDMGKMEVSICYNY